MSFADVLTWLSVGVSSRPASVGWQQVQGLLPVQFVAAGILDRGDHRRPPALYQLHPLLLALPLPLCFLGSPVGEGLCQVSKIYLPKEFIATCQVKFVSLISLLFHPPQASQLIWATVGGAGVRGPGGFDRGPGGALELGRLWVGGGAETRTGQRPGQEEKAGPEPSAPGERPVCSQLLHSEQPWRWEYKEKGFCADTSDSDPVSHHLMNLVTVLGASELGQYHALTVMEWLDVKTVSGSEVRLLRIRNPWGRCCWGGAWIGR